MNKFSGFTINYQKTIRESFTKMDANGEQFIIVTDDEDRVIGVVSDGDFRRAIWSSVSLESPVDTITNRNAVYLSEDYDVNKIKQIFSTTKIRQIPVLKDSMLVDIIFKEKFHGREPGSTVRKLHLPVVIMAGGAGMRLDPFTRILPKALIPIGEKPIIEIIMDKFSEYGVNDFFISLNDKARMVKVFLEDFGKKYNISYIEEEKPLGTAGALKFLDKRIQSSFIVSNCDIIIEEDYGKIYEFHKDGKYALTLVGSMQHHVIPYGVCKVGDRGELETLEEKPKYDLLVNTGMYILNPDSLKLIPPGVRFDITELINKLKKNGARIGVYPVSEKSWIDIGQWEEYRKAIGKLSKEAD